MIPADKSIRQILHNGSIQAEVALRLKDTLAAAGNPADWSPITEARVQMAVKVTLSAIRDELAARPGITWDESSALDDLLSQQRLKSVLEYLRMEIGGVQ